MPVSVRLCWTASRIAPTFWRPARNHIGFGGRPKSGIGRRKRRKAKIVSCGNDGPWKAWKTQEQVSHSSHRPWKSRKSGGIPTFPQLRRRSLFLREGKAKASPNLQRPKVGQIKPPKWAKRSCQTHPAQATPSYIYVIQGRFGPSAGSLLAGEDKRSAPTAWPRLRSSNAPESRGGAIRAAAARASSSADKAAFPA